MRRREICRFRHRRLKTPRCHPRPQKNRFKLDHEQVDHTNRDCFMVVFLWHGSANEKNEANTCAQLTSASVRTNVFVLLLVNGECSEGCICARVLLADLTESIM